jgi:hypothetical protein
VNELKVICRQFETLPPDRRATRPIELRFETPPQDRRAAIESKTLGIVRFVRRFYDIALDGFICEFIQDQDGILNLHGFWSVTKQSGAMRAMPQDPDKKLKIRQAPAKAYPFPVDQFKDPDQFRGKKALQDANTTNAHPTQAQLDAEEAGVGKPRGEDEVNELINRITGKSIGFEPRILAEVWDHNAQKGEEEYLGEVVLPALSRLPGRGHSNVVETYKIGKPGRVTRADNRKVRIMTDSSISMELFWRGNGEPFVNQLRLLLSHGNFRQDCAPRVQLWLEKDGDFSPLWTSHEPHVRTKHPQYKEQADLKIEYKEGDGTKQQFKRTKAGEEEMRIWSN